MNFGIYLAEQGLVPDSVIRMGIRQQLRDRLRQEQTATRALTEWADELRASPIAIEQDAANSQHYEVPTVFYQAVLGPHLKYSSAYYEDGVTELGEAEADMLARSCERAQLANGQEILEIGCGWGSLTLFMARNYPGSRITAISNSRTQREYIMGQAEKEGLTNVNVITTDISEYEHSNSVDRIVSIECFEHLRNYEMLFSRLRSWLKPGGMAFVHVFCHRTLAYPFEVAGSDDWMSEHFFTGGQMPAYNLFEEFDRDLTVAEKWEVPGIHYAKTARAWLDRLDAAGPSEELFPDIPESRKRAVMRRRWRIFFMACEELFGYDEGKEWFVGHYLLRPQQAVQQAA